jgi:hypothetical protein
LVPFSVFTSFYEISKCNITTADKILTTGKENSCESEHYPIWSFQQKYLRKDGVTQDCRKIHNKELHTI